MGLHSQQCIQSKDEPLSSSFDLTFLSPAKINLYFEILGKRSDGYHEIRSLYYAISLFDTLSFREKSVYQLTSDDHTLSCCEDNLITKAYNLFAKEVGIQRHFAIHISKKIPMQAGLGGGSSNAATTLWALNVLTQANLFDEDLALLSSALGSDVPFFFSQGAALCTGRGEKIELIDKQENLGPITIVKPNAGLSTPYVYSLVQCKKRKQRAFTTSSLLFYNDLEDAAFTAMPELAELKKVLIDCGFSDVVLSGSGTAFFCIGTAKKTLPGYCKVFYTKNLMRKQGLWYKNDANDSTITMK